MLTKQERATIYCMMLAEIEQPLLNYSMDKGLCLMSLMLFGDCHLLPELQAEHPSENWIGSGYWFPCDESGWQQRKQCLINALKKMYE